MKNPSEIPQDQELSKKRKISDSEEDNEILKDFHEQQRKYADIKTTRRGKGKQINCLKYLYTSLYTKTSFNVLFGIGTDREAETLNFLQKFQSKLSQTRTTKLDGGVDDIDDVNDDAW